MLAVLGFLLMIIAFSLKDTDVSQEINKCRDQRAVNRGRRARLERDAREAHTK